MKICMIAAMANNRIIGLNNAMPWHMPADLQHFKRVTMGYPVIMGRKTFESIGRPLPGRRNIVISRDRQFTAEGTEIAISPEQAVAMVAEHAKVFVIGGGAIYQHFLPVASELYLTFIHADIDGDTQFPDYELVGPWLEVAREQHLADDRNSYNYQFVTLKK